MYAQRAPPALEEYLEVAARLRRLDHAEGVSLSGHGQIDRVLAGDLQEDARVGPPLYAWPVECRKRGPNPRHVATRYRSRMAERIACSAASFASFISM